MVHRLILTLILMVYDLRLTLRLMVHRWRVLWSFVDINKQYNSFDALYWSKPQDAVAANHRALLHGTGFCCMPLRFVFMPLALLHRTALLLYLIALLLTTEFHGRFNNFAWWE
jgi:hypothetical protein